MRYIAAVTLMFALATPSIAANVYVTGFESLDFSPGGVNGQDSWNGNAPAVVQTSVVASGSQALKISTNGSFDGFLHTVADRSFGIPLVTVSVTVSQNVLISNLDEADFGIAYSGDAIASIVRFSFDGNVKFNNTVVGTWSANTWFDTTVIMDFDTQTAQISIGGGSLSAAIGFSQATANLHTVELATDNYIGDVTSSMVIDDLSITAVPEPATLSLLGLGLGSLLLRRKSRGK